MAEFDSNKYGQQMDKIAYAVAGVLAVIVLLIPVLFSGQVKEGELNAAVDDLKDAIKVTKDNLKRELPPDLSAELARQWDPGNASALDPEWLSERAPALIREIPRPPPEIPVHQPPALESISCARDAEKKAAYLIVKGRMGAENENVAIQKIELLRQTGGEGDFAVVAELPTAAQFEYADHAVEAGKTYTYQVRSAAVRDPAAHPAVKALPPEQSVQTSASLGPTEMVPHDYSLVLSSIRSPSTPLDPPTFYARFSYWDYAQGQVVQYKGGQLQVFKEKDRIGEDVAGGARFEFVRVDDTDRFVIVKDHSKVLDSREQLDLKDARAARPVDCWAQALTAAATATPAPAEGTPAPAEGTPAPAEGTPPGEEAPAEAVPETTAPEKTVPPPEKKTTERKTTEKKTTEKTTTETKRPPRKGGIFR